jgi:hypothetical protein
MPEFFVRRYKSKEFISNHHSLRILRMGFYFAGRSDPGMHNFIIPGKQGSHTGSPCPSWNTAASYLRGMALSAAA